MSRKPSQSITATADNAITWFFVGLLLIAVIAGLLGQVGIS
jgi:hypothetical protein